MVRLLCWEPIDGTTLHTKSEPPQSHDRAAFDEEWYASDDVYSWGPQPTERWRPYVDVTEDGIVPAGWTPESENDRLLARRRFHARCLYQYTMLLAIAKESRWECVPAMEAFRTSSLIELRTSEIELARFQMLARQIGVHRWVPKDKVFAAAAFCHGLHLFLVDAVARARGLKKYDRKDTVGSAPLRSETFSELCDALMEHVHAAHLLLSEGMLVLRLHWGTRPDGGEQEARHLAARMTLAIRALDAVLSVADR